MWKASRLPGIFLLVCTCASTDGAAMIKPGPVAPFSSPSSVFDVTAHPENVYGLAPGTTLNPNGVDVRDLFGASYSATEPHNVIFADRGKGFVNSVVIVLGSPVRLSSYNLFLQDDGASGSRGAREFRLYSGAALLDDVRLLDDSGAQKYTGVYGNSSLEISNTLSPDAPASARYTLQFVQNQGLPFGGVRADEFDAFAAPSSPGDANGDGRVDFADLLILAQHYGRSINATVSEGDFNNDGSVGFDDLLLLAQHYGQAAGPGRPAAVPEPAAVVLAGLLPLARRRRNASPAVDAPRPGHGRLP